MYYLIILKDEKGSEYFKSQSFEFNMLDEAIQYYINNFTKHYNYACAYIECPNGKQIDLYLYGKKY